jgi:hypothetical protein
LILRLLLPVTPLSPAVAIHLRPYQRAAVAAVHEHVAHGPRRALLVAALATVVAERVTKVNAMIAAQAWSSLSAGAANESLPV